MDMEAPTPQTPLTGHCSVIRDNVLYVYSPQAFQSLPLTTNGTWSQLATGVPVSGAACVGSEDTLWVVGGTTNTSSSTYSGLQRFTYATRKWDTVVPVVKVTSNRQNHAAVLLPGLGSILVYGGSQVQSSVPTTETFLISTEAPYGVRSFSAKHIPVSLPLLLPWDDASAVTLSGAANHSNIYQFHLKTGWRQITPAVPTSLKPTNLQQATLIKGSDNSRVLQLYDLSVSPSNITQIVLQRPNGSPAKPGTLVGQPTGTKRKRDLNIRTWPVYNDTLAPSSVRSGFGLARSTDGVVAITGGGSTTQSVALFNEEQNTWVNTTAFFGRSAHQKPLVPIETPSAKPVSPPATESTGEHHRTMVILGATLGCILGFVALLIILLLVLRWRRRKQAQQRKAGEDAEDDEDDEKDGMSFMDRGNPLAKEMGGIVYPASHHSLSVHDGKTGHTISHRRSETRGSEHSTTQLVPKDKEMFEMSPIREYPPPMRPMNGASRSTTSLQVPNALQPPPKRSSGWSGYFSRNSQRLSAGDRSSGRNTPVREFGLPGIATKRSSSATSDHNCNSHGPTELPPLDMGQKFHDTGAAAGTQESNNTRLSRVSSLRQSDERPRTVSSNFSRPSTARESLWSDGGHDAQTNWTPMSQTTTEWTNRRPRDTTTSSFYGSNSEYDSKHQSSGAGAPPAFTVTAPTPKIGALPEEDESDTASHGAAKEIAVRVVQAPIQTPGLHQPQQAAIQSDLSWVNLGTVR